MTIPADFTRVILFFKDRSSGLGWSETYWNAGFTTANQTLVSARALAQLRAQFLTSNCQIVWVRADKLGGARQFVASTPISTGPYTGQYGPTTPAFTNVRINVQIRSSGFGQVNRVFMAGLDQGDISDNTFTPSVEFGLKFAAFKSLLTNGVSLWEGLSRISQTGGDLRPITSIAAQTPRGNLIVTDDTSGLVAGDVVRISAPPTLVQGIQGYKIVHQVPSATTFFIGGAGVVGGLTTTSMAQWGNTNFSVWPVNDVTIEGITTRRAGRPFGQEVGRRSSRVPLRR